MWYRHAQKQNTQSQVLFFNCIYLVCVGLQVVKRTTWNQFSFDSVGPGCLYLLSHPSGLHTNNFLNEFKKREQKIRGKGIFSMGFDALSVVLKMDPKAMHRLSNSIPSSKVS